MIVNAFYSYRLSFAFTSHGLFVRACMEAEG
jgi:hypothetical protein